MSISLKPDTTAAVAFLRDLHAALGVRPVLSASFTNAEGKKGKFLTRDFAEPVDWDAVHTWIAERQGKANLYFCVNPVIDGKGDKKPTRADIRSMAVLQVDVDVRVGEPQPEGIARIIKTFEAYKTPPSCIIASGGGAQAFWFLKEPVAVNGDLAVAEDLKLYNKQIERDLAADACHSLDHVFRLPFSVNIPNEVKLKKGRVPSLSRLHLFDAARRYSLDDFEKLQPEEPAPLPGFHDTGKYEAISPDDARLQHLDAKWVALGRTGVDLDRKYEAADGKTDRSKMALAFVTALLRAKVDEQVIASILMDASWAVGSCIRDKGNETQRHLKRIIERGQKFVDEDLSKPAVLGEDTWLKTYNQFRVRGGEHLILHNGDYLDYVPSAGCYREMEKKAVDAKVCRFLDESLTVIGNDKITGKPILGPFKSCNKDVAEVVGKLNCYGLQDASLAMPRWLDGRDGPDPNNLISFPNGILDLGTGTLMQPDPMLLTTNAVGFNYDPNAPEPNEWKRFLAQIYNGEQDQIDALQEMFGYSLSSDVSQEKAFMWLGPKRSGKDTQKNMLCTLLSPNAVCGPTLDLMGTPFGMSALINKQMAIVGDMRLGHKTDRDLLAENVLKLTGRGLFTFDRKYKGHWTGRLPCKLLLISNEMPRIKDTSGALASRFIIFNTRTSFYDHEDPNLFRDKLAPEAPGVLLWALEGLRRVRERGSLAESESSTQERLQLARDGSPVLAFFEECLSLDPKGDMTVVEMHRAYAEWSAACGLHPLAKNAFVRDLIAATGGKVRSYRRSDKARTGALRGATRKGGSDDQIPF
jgi:P4 family phage/plasmid primase-like protien